MVIPVKKNIDSAIHGLTGHRSSKVLTLALYCIRGFPCGLLTLLGSWIRLVAPVLFGCTLLPAASGPFFFQKVNHARRPEFAIELRILAPQAGGAHIHPVFFTTVGLPLLFRIPATGRHRHLLSSIPRCCVSHQRLTPAMQNPASSGAKPRRR